MAKKRAEDAPPSLLWKDTFSDLMNLLLCFFVLLFSMSTVDADKFQELAASLASAFSVLPSGGSTIKSDGILVGSGASQLNELSDYYNNMGMNSEGDVELDKESNTVDEAYEKVQEEGLEQSEKMADTIQAALDMSNVDSSQVEITTTSQYVMLSLSSGILFDSGKADLKAEAISVVDKVADAVKLAQEKYPDVAITKVAQIIDLDIGETTVKDDTTSAGANIADIAYVDVKNNDSTDITVSYTDGGKTHYAVLNVTVGFNTKAKDYEEKKSSLENSMKVVVSQVNTEALKYSYSELNANKATVESNLLSYLRDLFQTDSITSVTLTKMVVS